MVFKSLVGNVELEKILKIDAIQPEIPQILDALNNSGVITQAVIAEVDARGLACPLPLLKAKQAMRAMATNELLRVIATDAGTLKDFLSFAQITGQRIEGFYLQDQVYYYLIRKQ